MNLLISACLLGCPCRYDGKSVPLPQDVLRELERHFTLIPICPETAGGLPTPRVPAERVGDRVMTLNGRDVTELYRAGAEEALRLFRQQNCVAALLKERSPSCGCGTIYDGTFTGAFRTGNGVTAELLLENGVPVRGES